MQGTARRHPCVTRKTADAEAAGMLLRYINFLPRQNPWSFIPIQTKWLKGLESLNQIRTELYLVFLKTEDTTQISNLRKCLAFIGKSQKDLFLWMNDQLLCICLQRKWTKSFNRWIRFKNNSLLPCYLSVFLHRKLDMTQAYLNSWDNEQCPRS